MVGASRFFSPEAGYLPRYLYLWIQARSCCLTAETAAYASSYPSVHCGSTKQGGIGEPLPALGYLLQYHGERVVYTGDCGLDSNLEPYISGADLLIIEATLNEPGGEMEERVHLSLESAQRFAASAKKAFIIHRPGDLPPVEVGG